MKRIHILIALFVVYGIRAEFPELRKWQFGSRTDFSYAVFLADKTYLIILNNVTGTTATKFETLPLQ